MIKFELIDQLPYKQFVRITRGEKPLYLGTPFLGGPRLGADIEATLNKKILIDSNVFSDFWKNKNRNSINAFMFEAEKMSAEVSHIFAVSELFINHETPEEAIREYYESLDSNFNVSIPLGDRDKFISIVKNRFFATSHG